MVLNSSSRKARFKTTAGIEEDTTVSTYLPYSEDDVTVEDVDDQELPTGKERILLVDDEKGLIRAFTLTLSSLGYDVVSSSHPHEAVTIFEQDPGSFDLVITDMIMPQMNGDKLAAKLMDIRPDIPVILCSGFGELITEDEAQRIGIKAFAIKPIVTKELADTVRMVLDQ